MDYGRMLTRAFEITRRYRALWLFGFLLALFGGGGGEPFSYGFNSGDFTGGRGGALIPGVNIPWDTLLTILAVVACVVVIWIVLSILLRLVSRAALIGSVEELEAKGTTPTVSRGFGIGSDRFLPLLGIALVVNVPLVIGEFVLFALSVLPLLAVLIPAISSGRRPPNEGAGLIVVGAIGTVALVCVSAMIVLAVQLIIHPLYEFFVRASVIGRRGALDGIREGYRIVRANLGPVAVLYILVIAIGIGFGFLMLFVALFLLAIPAGAAFVIYLITQSIAPTAVAAIVLGIPMAIILVFIAGLYQVFESALWTEGYLAITAPARAAA